MGSRKRNICIKKLYLDQLHREFLLISLINPFRQTKLANFIQSTSSNNRPSAYFKFRLQGGAPIGRKALFKKLLTCTDSAEVEGERVIDKVAIETDFLGI